MDILGIFFCLIIQRMLCVLIRVAFIEAILMSTLNILLLSRRLKNKKQLHYRRLLPDLVL